MNVELTDEQQLIREAVREFAEAAVAPIAAGAGTCTAMLSGHEYILNGSKIFITNAPYAEIYIVFAKTDPAQGTRGMSAFIVEKDTPGFSVGEAEHKLGIRGSSTPPLYFSDCRIPKDALLGGERARECRPVQYAACLECGTCLAVAAPGALKWRYLRGGFGGQFRCPSAAGQRSTRHSGSRGWSPSG